VWLVKSVDQKTEGLSRSWISPWFLRRAWEDLNPRPTDEYSGSRPVNACFYWILQGHGQPEVNILGGPEHGGQDKQFESPEEAHGPARFEGYRGVGTPQSPFRSTHKP
jgi:hypothetical protein